MEGRTCACAVRLEEVFEVSGTVEAVTGWLGSTLVGVTCASLTGRFEGRTCGSGGLLEEAFALSYTSPCLTNWTFARDSRTHVNTGIKCATHQCMASRARQPRYDLHA